MRRASWTLILAIPTLFAADVGAGEPASEAPEIIPLRNCSLEYERSTLVGANQNSGLIQECLVRPGDRVKAGQVLGRLFNKDALAEVQFRTVALESSETTILQREATLQLEKIKLKRAETLVGKRALSLQDLQIQRLIVRTSELDLLAGTQAKRMAESQLLQAKALVTAREITAPHDGVVVEIFKNAGESLSSNLSDTGVSGYAIFKIVEVDRLRVVGYLDAGDAWHVRPGQVVRVVAELEGGTLPIGGETFTGKIAFVDREIDPKTRTCRIFATVENRDGLLRSGLQCRLEIEVGGAPAAKPAAAVVAPPIPPRTAATTKSQ